MVRVAPAPILSRMGRRERFLQYQWAAWPDEELLAQLTTMQGMVNIRRIEQNVMGSPNLVVELADEYFQTGQVMPDGTWPHPERHNRVLRLTWESRWEERDGGLKNGGVTVFEGGEIYALETYTEGYCGPYAVSYSWNPDAPECGSTLLEVVNDPDPWITEILNDSPSYGVFPLGGRPVQVHPDTWERNKGNGWETPTGRYFPADYKGSHSGEYFWTGPQPPTLEQQAEFDAAVKRNQEAQAALERSRPRYRHLFIASNTVMVEILCEGLPRWEWVEVAEA